LILGAGPIGAEDGVGCRERDAERNRPANERAAADISLEDLAGELRQLFGAFRTLLH
jgi:hypothetical protein